MSYDIVQTYLRPGSKLQAAPVRTPPGMESGLTSVDKIRGNLKGLASTRWRYTSPDQSLGPTDELYL
jgi:hypothetical protein